MLMLMLLQVLVMLMLTMKHLKLQLAAIYLIGGWLDPDLIGASCSQVGETECQ